MTCMQDDVLAEANILMVSHTPGVSFAELFSALAARMPCLAWVLRPPSSQTYLLLSLPG